MKLGSGLLLVLACRLADGAPAPIVYSDDSITVHAAIEEAGTAPIHLGNVVTFTVEAVFDPDEVQVESLDGDWFRRAFAETAPLSLYRSDRPVTKPEDPDRVRMTMQWQFQVLDCPQEGAHCPGPRRYELPLVGLTYRLVAAAEADAANRSARFRPWPGRLDIVPSIHFDPRGDTDIGEVIAGGAWPAPKRLVDSYAGAGALLVLGGSLLTAGFVGGRRGRSAPRMRAVPRDSRWERAALQLENDVLGDEAWAELLRRCITWYCQDELGRNPFEWLRTEGRDAAAEDVTGDAAECRALFRDVIAESGIDAARRDGFRERFAQVAGKRITAE